MSRMTTMAALIFLLLAGPALAADPPPLVLEAKIPLGDVKGRIDHLVFDADRGRLIVAELGNDSVAIVDLASRAVIHRIAGLSEPQGVAYHPATGTLYVANADDGSLRLFRASDFAPIGRIELGSDADNVRIDPWRDRIVVGHGKGALAVIDPASRRKLKEMPLDGHPEGFQFDETGGRIFANVPDARHIAVLDAVTGKAIKVLQKAGARGNFPMAVDADGHRVLVAYRAPARLVGFNTSSGQPDTDLDTCRDADDVFVDTRRHRIYVSCGEGAIDVFAQTGNGHVRIARIPTVSGARTALFVPTNDRLYLAVRSTWSESAAIWVLRPVP